MATKLDPSEIVSFKEILVANSIQQDTAVQLLIKNYLFSDNDFFTVMKKLKKQTQEIGIIYIVPYSVSSILN
jgi:hypothetical protein